MSVALRMYRWNGEQIHVLYERQHIVRAWLCGERFEDVKISLCRVPGRYRILARSASAFPAERVQASLLDKSVSAPLD